MKCYYCKGELILLNELEFEDCNIEGSGVCAIFICKNQECKTTVEVYKEV